MFTYVETHTNELFGNFTSIRTMLKKSVNFTNHVFGIAHGKIKGSDLGDVAALQIFPLCIFTAAHSMPYARHRLLSTEWR